MWLLFTVMAVGSGGSVCSRHAGATGPDFLRSATVTEGPTMAVVNGGAAQWAGLTVALLLLLLHLLSLAWASDPPQVRGKPHLRHVAKRGKNTRLVCPVEAESAPFMVWKKDGETIHNGWTRFKVTQDGQLRIRNVHMRDAGLYVCRATNGFGSISINYTVVVLDEESGMVQQQDNIFPKSPHEDLTKDGMAPEFKDADKMAKEDIIRPVGSTVRLKCRARGNPEPHVSWFKDDEPLYGDGEKDEEEAEEEEEEGAGVRRRPLWILKLSHVQELDTGHYTCMVANRLGHVNHTYRLEVIDQIRTKPKLISSHPQNTTVEYGGTASFQCRVKSIVQPHIKWLKRVDDPENSQALNRTIEVKGQKFMVLRTAGEVWSGPDGSYLNKLVIQRATPRDAGMYICLGANNMGYSLRSAYLTVVPAGQMGSSSESLNSSSSSSSSTASKLPLYVGVPAGAILVLILLILTIVILQNRKKCEAGRGSTSKRHHLPVPTADPRDAAAGFYNSYHPSPTTTNTGGGGTLTATLTSSSGVGGGGGGHSVNVPHGSFPPTSLHGGLTAPGGPHKVPKTPAPSLDFGSDFTSVSHSLFSHPQSLSQQPMSQPSMHFVNPHAAYGY
ncbi:hypothetical protein ACOMHN_029946 [Nucella lapillus]